MTRGLRNNNPLNIRRNNTKWQGLSATQTDKSFFQFKTMAYGYRAAFKTLQTYIRIITFHDNGTYNTVIIMFPFNIHVFTDILVFNHHIFRTGLLNSFSSLKVEVNA